MVETAAAALVAVAWDWEGAKVVTEVALGVPLRSIVVWVDLVAQSLPE